jgi:hypothetical protein
VIHWEMGGGVIDWEMGGGRGALRWN